VPVKQCSERARTRHCHPVGVKTLFIEPASPQENGYCESFDSKLRDELLDGEIFTTLSEAEVLIESWRRHYSAVRPHSSLRCRPPAPEAILRPARGLPYAALQSANGPAKARPLTYELVLQR
jgi:putative transposase